MTPRERTVLRAIAKALAESTRDAPVDMDALALSFNLPPYYPQQTKAKRASMLLEALVDAED